jgi:hypothetical protein
MPPENPYQSPTDDHRLHGIAGRSRRKTKIIRFAVSGGLGGFWLGATAGAAALGILTIAMAVGGSWSGETNSEFAAQTHWVTVVTGGFILGSTGGAVAGGFLGLATGVTIGVFGPNRTPAVKCCILLLWIVCGMAVGLGSGRLFFTEPGLGSWIWQGVGALICAAAAVAVERLLSRGLNRLAGPPRATYQDS